MARLSLQGRIYGVPCAAYPPGQRHEFRLAAATRGSAVGRSPAPVPRLVDDAVRVVTRVAQLEAVRAGMALQPGERIGSVEGFLCRRIARRADVQRMAAVVFTEARCGIDLQDLRHAQPARPFPFEDAQLVGMAAKTRDRVQCHAIPCSVQAHPAPALRSAAAQPQRAGEAVTTGEMQQAGFGLQRQAAVVCVALGVQAQLLQALLQPGQVVLLDAGSTNLAIAQQLPAALGLTLITNAPQIATAASVHEGTAVQLIGGRLAGGGGAVGAEALAQVQRLRADVYLPGPCAVDGDTGVWAMDSEEATLKRAMVASPASTRSTIWC
ncbi:hypothetical protein G6F24_013699 [Rhizopus arrhizus]|nr:hypothetical protein G6F24_013699 [Rhizopus arrhizus]